MFSKQFNANTILMLRWNLVRANPLTYRSINGAIHFEVTLVTDNRKDAITVTRTKGDKFEVNVFRDCAKALRWCEEHAGSQS
jgi:hypothetical protein